MRWWRVGWHDIEVLQQQINILTQEFRTMSDATGTEIAHIQAAVNQMGQDAANTSIAVGGIKTDLDAIKAEIDALKNAPAGQLSAENQAALDALSASADSAMTNADTALSGANSIKATADAMTPPPPAVP